MAQVRISLIGAGSGCFSLSLVQDLCSTPGLAGSTICFMDVDEERLDAVHELCGRMAQEKGAELVLEKTMDRRASLAEADFVINTALAAGHERLREGWRIARKHGFDFPGSYHVMYDEAFWINFYQLRLFEGIVEDMLEICPEAYHLMVANPVVAGVTHLARKYPQSRTIGLCHGYNGVYEVARILGLEREHITFEIPGVNHFVWLTEFRYKGKNAFPVLDRWIEAEAEDYWSENDGGYSGPLNRKCVDLYRRHGALPIGDTAHWTGACWPWWYHGDEATAESWGENDPAVGWDWYFTLVRDSAERIEKVAGDPAVSVTEEFGGQSHEPMIPLIEAIACDISTVHIVNVQNSGGFVPGIPTDFQVEIGALCSGRGVQGIQTNGLPRSILSHALRDRVAPVEMELDAYTRGCRESLVELVLMDRWATSRAQAEAFVGEILALPYHGEMREHYR